MLGSQVVGDELLRRIENQIPGITKALYAPAEQISEGSDKIKPAVLTAFARDGQTALPALINILDNAGHEIQSVEIREPDLEAVFLALTGRALRD